MITIILTLPILKSGLETGKCNRRLCSKISVLVLVLITGEPVLPPEGTTVVLEPAPPATVAPAGEDPEKRNNYFSLFQKHVFIFKMGFGMSFHSQNVVLFWKVFSFSKCGSFSKCVFIFKM